MGDSLRERQKIMELTIEVKCPSWNKLYSSPHWSVRSRIAKEIHQLVKYAVHQQYSVKGKLVPRFDKCEITITAYFKGKRRHDISNICEKVFEDGLVNARVIEDDNLNIVVGIHKYAKNKAKEDKVVIEIKEINVSK